VEKCRHEDSERIHAGQKWLWMCRLCGRWEWELPRTDSVEMVGGPRAARQLLNEGRRRSTT
jgi:hypothetical protein